MTRSQGAPSQKQEPEQFLPNVPAGHSAGGSGGPQPSPRGAARLPWRPHPAPDTCPRHLPPAPCPSSAAGHSRGPLGDEGGHGSGQETGYTGQDKEGPAWADLRWGAVVRGGLETTGQQGLGGGQPGPWRAGGRAGSALLPPWSTLGTPCWSPPCSGMRAARRLWAHSRASGKNAGATEPRPTREGCGGCSGGLAGHRARPHTCPGWGGNTVEGGPCQPQHRAAAPVLLEGKLPAQEGQHGTWRGRAEAPSTPKNQSPPCTQTPSGAEN